MSHKLIRLILLKQLRNRFTARFSYLLLLHLWSRLIFFTNLCLRRFSLKKMFRNNIFFKQFLFSTGGRSYNRGLLVRFNSISMFRRVLKQHKNTLQCSKKVHLLKRGSYVMLKKATNLSPYFTNFKKYAILVQMIVISSAISMHHTKFLSFGFSKNVATRLLNSYIFSVKMLKILRRAQIFCTIRTTFTNVYLTITDGCGEVKLSFSAGQLGFIKRKTRKKFSVFEKMIENLVLKLKFNTMLKVNRLSFVNVPKFMIYQIVAEFTNRGVSVDKIWFYTKTSHSNFNKFKFKKLRRI